MSKEIKLHLGCGNKKIHGFTNIDIRPEIEPDLIDDISTLKKIENNSVDLIYACHVLEHFSFEEVRKTLQRWNDILKPSGILRLSVPDMDAIFAHYFYWKELDLLKGYLWGGQDYKENFHKSGWDFETLSYALNCAGFDNIEKWWWENLEPHNYIDDYSQIYFPKKTCQYSKGKMSPALEQSVPADIPITVGKLMSLNIQATKWDDSKEE